MAAVVNVQPRVPDEPAHQPGVGQRDDRVVVPGQDQRRLPQSRQQRQAGPARRGGELVQVAARRAGLAGRPASPSRPARNRSWPGRRRGCLRPGAGTRGPRSAARSPGALRTEGRAGTMGVPMAVATSTSRRHLARWDAANCWATPPPQEMPSTSTRSWPSSVSMAAISRQSPLNRYGLDAGGEPPMPGGSNLITSTAGSSSRTNGSSSSSRAPMPLISSSGSRGPRPASFGPCLIATFSR